MSQRIENVFHYQETDNPYSNGEEISVSLVLNDRKEKYVEVYVTNDDENGCGIYLTPQQTEELINELKSKL